MTDCNLITTIIHSFLQLTPLVQVLLAMFVAIAISSVFYCLKEIFSSICKCIVQRKHGFEDNVEY